MTAPTWPLVATHPDSPDLPPELPAGPWQPDVADVDPFPVARDPAAGPELTEEEILAAARQITIVDLGCGHLPGECDDLAECAYWRGVARGEYAAPAGLPGPIARIGRAA